jgi:hypothetical protein
MRKLIAAAFAVLLLQGTAHAKVTSLEGANLGEYWYGPERTLESLKGHVVLWENWGYN